MQHAAAFVTLMLLLPNGAADSQPLTIDTNFPGGSAKVETIDQERRLIRLSPSPHRDRGWICWWYVHIKGLRPGEILTLDVGPAPWATPDRATFSLDHKTWQQTAPGKREGKRIVYRQQVDGPEAWFAWGPPLVPDDAARMVREAAARLPEAEVFNLATTREGRETPALRLTASAEATPRFGLWIQARQHAWESGSSWVAKGLLDWLTSDDPGATWLRRHADITFIPIMDIDNTQRGAGGKNQKPQDHNRDWTDEPHWNAVAAAQEGLMEIKARGNLDFFIDLHNPGPQDKDAYFYLPPPELLSEAAAKNLARFLAAARQEISGPIPFEGRTIPSGSKYDPKWQAISKNWVATHGGDRVVPVTLETAWNTPGSTTEGYQRVGQQLGRAIVRYLKERAPGTPE
ncbi:Zinc carboxypeptidase [Planctomycetes bacterium Pan216]|uniref:Zinc carboxypeptidase n=1 Tax=Kolteria novifilia TaxID=2527975 RepID=A0A518B8Z5_9BACT|nr:Zinc carboxypeptidase [Planctomycetes bacterium Pan216]